MKDWLTGQPHWLIQLLIGTAVGLALPQAIRAVQWLWGTRRRHVLHGRWYCYYFSTKGDSQVLITEEWSIRRGLRHALTVRAISRTNHTDYQGHLTIEGHHLLVDMISVAHFVEHVHIRFPFPMASMDRPIVGIGVQYDYNGTPEAAANVLSDRPLSEVDVRELIQKKTEVASNNVLFRCRA